MLPLPRGGPVGLRNQIQGQGFGQDLGVEFSAFAGALGDEAQFLGVGQHQPLGQRLQPLPQPLVAGGRLDDRLERSQAGEEGLDLVRLGTGEGLALQDLPLLVADAQGDTLLVEVDADEVHGWLLLWGPSGLLDLLKVYHAFQDNREPARPPSHSFTLPPSLAPLPPIPAQRAPARTARPLGNRVSWFRARPAPAEGASPLLLARLNPKSELEPVRAAPFLHNFFTRVNPFGGALLKRLFPKCEQRSVRSPRSIKITGRVCVVTPG
jgi:hypothetical protein